MSTEAIPGGTPDGWEPFRVSACADGWSGEEEDAWLRPMMAEADEDEAWICEEQAASALSVLVPELVLTTSTAELAMARARDAARRLPACTALLRDGRISEFQLKIITEATQPLSDEDAAEADAGHTIPWPDGPSCECNLGLRCKR